MRVSLEAHAEEELISVLAELDAAPASDEADVARYLAWVALATASDDEASRDEACASARAAETPLVSATSRLASAHVTAGRLQRADRIAELGIELLGKREARGLPLLWRVRAESARLRGAWDEAEEHLDGMLTAIEAAQLSDPEERWYRALCDVGRAQIAVELGRLDRCAMLLAAAEETARRPDSGALFVAAKLVELDLALMREDPRAALETAESVRKDPRFERSTALLELPTALAHLQRARQSRAREGEFTADLDAARPRLEKLTQDAGTGPVERFKAWIALAELELLRSDAERARAALAEAEALASTLSSDGELGLRELLLLPTLRWELARDDEEERATARTGVEDAFGRLLDQWGGAASRPDGIGFLKLSWRTQLVGAAIECELAQGDAAAAERAFELVLRAEEQGSLARASNLTTQLGQLRTSLLAPGRGAVVLLPGHFRSHLFLVGDDSLRHWPLHASRDQLTAAARTVTDALQELGKPDSTALTERVLPPEARAVLARWSEAYVVGFDLLADLPFGVLLGHDGAPIGRNLPHAALPSLLSGERLLRREAPSQAQLDLALFVAQRPGASGLDPLPFGDDERTRLVAPFERSAIVEHATRSDVLSERPRARIDHFVAHARRAAGGNSAALILEPDTDGAYALGPGDVRGMRTARLVILSACASGKGSARFGDDLLTSLGGAFLDAGARCVVLARFPVEYHATLALMEELGARVARGVPPARALQEARAALANTPNASGAASFEVLGLGHEAVFPRR